MIRSDMPCELCSGLKAGGALVTVVGLLPLVDTFMILKLYAVLEALGAELADIGNTLLVDQFMEPEGLGRLECLYAHVAFVRPVCAVLLLVGEEVELVGELGRAHVAMVWLPSHVNLFVNLHTGHMRECLVTVHALKHFLESWLFPFLHLPILLCSVLVYLDALLGEVFVASGAVLRLPDLDGARIRHLRLSLILRVRTEVDVVLWILFQDVGIVQVLLLFILEVARGSLELALLDGFGGVAGVQDNPMEPVRVLPQTFLSEIFITNIALDEFVRRVDTSVLCQFPHLTEGSSAVLALVFGLVQLDVSLQLIVGRKHSRAQRANKPTRHHHYLLHLLLNDLLLYGVEALLWLFWLNLSGVYSSFTRIRVCTIVGVHLVDHQHSLRQILFIFLV